MISLPFSFTAAQYGKAYAVAFIRPKLIEIVTPSLI